jgi:hypothetical protein
VADLGEDLGMVLLALGQVLVMPLHCDQPRLRGRGGPVLDKPVVGRGHASLLTMLDTWHSKTVRGIPVDDIAVASVDRCLQHRLPGRRPAVWVRAVLEQRVQACVEAQVGGDVAAVHVQAPSQSLHAY